jgi:hypothetical protein
MRTSTAGTKHNVYLYRSNQDQKDIRCLAAFLFQSSGEQHHRCKRLVTVVVSAPVGRIDAQPSAAQRRRGDYRHAKGAIGQIIPANSAPELAALIGWSLSTWSPYNRG